MGAPIFTQFITGFWAHLVAHMPQWIPAAKKNDISLAGRGPERALASLLFARTWKRTKTVHCSRSFLNTNRIHVWLYLPTFIYHKDQPNVGKYTIHGSYGTSKNQLNMG